MFEEMFYWKFFTFIDIKNECYQILTIYVNNIVFKSKHVNSLDRELAEHDKGLLNSCRNKLIQE